MAGYSARGLHGHVVAALGRRVVQGGYPPGSVLDLEGLAREFGVSRTVVREAVRALAARGLLDALPHRGTFVLPRADWRLLDPDVLAWHAEVVDEHFLANLAEVRSAVEPLGASLAATRRSEDDLRGIEAAFDELAAASRTRDAAAVVSADLVFHRALLAASGNEMLTALEVLLEPALRIRGTLALTGEFRDDYVNLHRAVLEAVRHGASDEAGEAMRTLLSQAAHVEVSAEQAR